ncbi:MAG: TAXI family TRAP transporter solute-binding subunit [Rhizobiales bacterium]|nr:TAXI family TRAP transporter solute-binding subunit [Hyphomicrobiales bacterium]
MLFFAPASVASAASADPAASQSTYAARVEQVNTGTVGVISGGIGGTYVRIAADLAAVLNPEGDIRVLPILGQGSVQNVTDLLYLKGVDVAIVQSDVLAHIEREAIHDSIKERIHYVTKLYNEELHLLAGAGIERIEDLAGQPVNFDVAGSGTYMTATTVFKALGIEVRPVSMDQALAIEKIRAGEIAATVYVAGRPASVIADLADKKEFRLLDVPYVAALQDTYLPVRLSAEDYPGLVPADSTVSSIAVGAVMAVYNWSPKTDRHRRVVEFIESFLSRFERFLDAPRHPKWREVSLHATLPGWTRFQPVQDWLDANKPADPEALQAAFNQFLDGELQQGSHATLTAEARQQLFQQFLAWRSAARSQ